jgi:hypothetical protein
MSLTFTNEPLNFGGLGAVGGRRFRLTTIDFDTSYPTGGEPVSISDLDFPSAIESIVLVGITDGASTCFNAVFDAENSKIVVMNADDGLEAGSTDNLSGVSMKFFVIGY